MSTTIRLGQPIGDDSEAKDTKHAVWVGEGLAMDRVAVGVRSVCIVLTPGKTIAAVITPKSPDPIEDLEWAMQALVKHIAFLKHKQPSDIAPTAAEIGSQMTAKPFLDGLSPQARLNREAVRLKLP